MRIGVALLPELDWARDRARWRRAEAYGFDHAWTYDHLAWRTLADGPWHATIPTLVAAALETSTIRLGTLVTTPNFRHPVPFAKELMTLDVMSSGRLTVALGVGAPGYDATVLGRPELAPVERRARFEEFHTLLDELLSSPVTTWSGEWYAAVQARMRPGPVQHPRPPLLVAANGPRGIRMAAAAARRPGDGWVTMGSRDRGMSGEEWWASVAKSARLMDELLAQEDGRTLVRLLYLGSRTEGMTALDQLRDQLARAAALRFTDVVVSWPRAEQPFAGDERLLEELADALPELKCLSA